MFDLDGTLLDSDQALVDPFIQLGVPIEEIESEVLELITTG